MEEVQEQEIDLMKLFKALLQKWWLIILVTIVSGVIAICYTVFFVEPEYEAVSKLYVYNQTGVNQNLSSADINLSKTLVNTYIVILESDSVLGQVCDTISSYQGQSGFEYLGTEEYTPTRLKKMISASSINNTESFQIVVKANDPYSAKFINDAILFFLPDQIIRVVKAGAVEIIDTASIATEPSSPSLQKNVLIGALLGFVLVCGVIALLSILDTRIRNEEDLTDNFKDIPIIGTIPSFTLQNNTVTLNSAKEAEEDSDDYEDD